MCPLSTVLIAQKDYLQSTWKLKLSTIIQFACTIEDNRKRVKQAKFSIQLLCFAFSKPKFFYCFLVCLQIFTTCFRSQDYMRETVNIQRFQHCFQTINYSLLSSQCSPCLPYEKQIQTIKGTYLFRSLYQIMRTYFCNIDLHHIFTTYKEQ